MKIFWVEDKGEVVTNAIFKNKIFNHFWTDNEISSLVELEKEIPEIRDEILKKFSSPLFLAADLEEAWKIISEAEEPFDKIIIDIEFPAEKFDFNNGYIKKNTLTDNNFDKIVEVINSDQYMGFNLAHLIISHYEEKYKWNLSNIKSKIAFFSANSVTIEDFNNLLNDRLKELVNNDFTFETHIKKIKQFNKNNDKDFEEWLKTDDYILILDRYLLGDSGIKKFIKIRKYINDVEQIEENLSCSRKLLEEILYRFSKFDNIDKYTPPWYCFFKGKYSKNGNLILKNFIRFLADYRSNYNLEEIEEKIKKINQEDKRSLKEEALENLKKEKYKSDFYLNTKLNVSPIIACNLYCIYEVASAFGAHNGKIGYKPTINTAHSIIYQLKEIILWFGEVMETLQELKENDT